MISASIRSLLEKLNRYTRGALESSVGLCVNRSHYEVTISHLLLQSLEEGNGDLNAILESFSIEAESLRDALLADLLTLRTGNPGKPLFSPHLVSVFEAAWADSSLNLGETKIRTGAIVLALRRNPSYLPQSAADVLGNISVETLIESFKTRTQDSKEAKELTTAPKEGEGIAAPGTFLSRFTVNFTEMAKAGKIDPVFGRDEEIRQCIDILSRRRKNNPILVGEAGVGKTAVVEGLALKIAEGEIPKSLQEVAICGLDMGLLAAGAGVRGEFENRLKGVLKETKESKVPIILFIDEAHTMIGAGGAEGQNDAANLLKPELARGELKVLGATTFAEFRKYFEKDPAMARRFQQVKIEEPDPATASVMLRGLRSRYESFHGVKITYEAIQAACQLSNKYIAGRQLPDKAVDLLDTSAARVKMGLTSKPGSLLALEEAIQNLTVEIAALETDQVDGVLKSETDLDAARIKLRKAEEQASQIRERWQSEWDQVQEIIEIQRQMQQAEVPDQREAKRADLEQKWEALEELQGEDPLVHAHVSKSVVAQIISEWTGIPAGNMVKDEAKALLDLEAVINERVMGQERGVAQIASTLRSAKMELGNPDAPLGVFLVTGPSGVGKTEVARTISDILFGGERSVVTINMSEYQDSMSVTQLKGASAGYVGYGDGGVLTEGVRKRPYTVVILDEVEKAHKDVLNMFYQVFDRGMLRDGEGRDISFRNTVILMTSNLGSDTILEMASSEDERPDLDTITEAIRPELTAHFQAALLARCKVVPFLPLGPDSIKRIVTLKLMKLGNRLMDKHRLAFAVSPQVLLSLVDQCTVVQSGARNIDGIIDRQILPRIASQLLENIAAGDQPTHLFVGMGEGNQFEFHFSSGDFDAPELRPSPTVPEGEIMEDANPLETASPDATLS